jgi:hypothetical protein
VYPADDVPGDWIAHCLDVDVALQGPSIEAAFIIARDAMLSIVLEDIGNGRDPLEHRKKAPPEDWERLHELQRDGSVGMVPMAFEGDVGAAALQLHIVTWPLEKKAKADQLPTAWTQPLAHASSI